MLRTFRVAAVGGIQTSGIFLCTAIEDEPVNGGERVQLCLRGGVEAGRIENRTVTLFHSSPEGERADDLAPTPASRRLALVRRIPQASALRNRTQAADRQREPVVSLYLPTPRDTAPRMM
jgi:hypothetical protein